MTRLTEFVTLSWLKADVEYRFLNLCRVLLTPPGLHALPHKLEEHLLRRLTRVGGDILVSHVDPIVGAIGDIGWLAMHVACSDVAASGIQARLIQLLVFVPRMEEAGLLEKIMRDASRAAREIGVSTRRTGSNVDSLPS